MCSRASRTSLFVIVLVAAGVPPIGAEPSISPANVSIAGPGQRCAGTLVDVTAVSPDEGRLACRAASQALQSIARCQVALRRPLHVQISDAPRHPLGRPILGFFEASRERVVVAGYEKMPLLAKGTPFEALSQKELFKSIIVHEVIHGVLHQNSGQHPINHVGGEYLAYALQLESLPTDERDRYWRSIEKRVDMEGLLFTDVLLLVDPFLFAALAYQHFKAAPDNCADVRALLRGEVTFILTWLY